jgi:glycosyltransferase involved in cell wall biosynthesis
MAAGLPVVISDQIGTDVVRPGLDGLRFAAGDVQALASCIRALAGDYDLRTRLGRSAQQRICSEFTIEHEAGQFAEAVRSVHPRRSATRSRSDQGLCSDAL